MRVAQQFTAEISGSQIRPLSRAENVGLFEQGYQDVQVAEMASLVILPEKHGCAFLNALVGGAHLCCRSHSVGNTSRLCTADFQLPQALRSSVLI